MDKVKDKDGGKVGGNSNDDIGIKKKTENSKMQPRRRKKKLMSSMWAAH
jgi:hypothetical protein